MVFPALISGTPKVVILLSDNKIFRSPLIVSPLLLTLLAAAFAAATDAASVTTSIVMEDAVDGMDCAGMIVLCLKPPDPNLSTVFIIYISIIIILIKYHKTSHGCLISIAYKYNNDHKLPHLVSV